MAPRTDYSQQEIVELWPFMTAVEQAQITAYLQNGRSSAYTPPDIIQFARDTLIEIPTAVYGRATIEPFSLWPSQVPVIRAMQEEVLLVILKARQLGISWLACLLSLRMILEQGHQRVLMFSQGLLEAGELIRRVKFLYNNHKDVELFPRPTKDNESVFSLDNGSEVRSLPATKKAGRSFTASMIVLDEYAFMQNGAALFTAAKPTIDNGGKMLIISTADYYGSGYHQFWQAAESGTNGFRPLFLPWQSHPKRGADWRTQRVAESIYPADVKREYPENPTEAFTHTAGLVYDVWLDDYDVEGETRGNVRAEADYVEDGGTIYWFVDDGYAGKIDQKTGMFTADSHPRVFLLLQLRSDGRLCLFYESYHVQMLEDDHIAEVAALPYPAPEFVVVDKSAAQIRGRLHTKNYFTQKGPAYVEESIKEFRRWLAPDDNDWRRFWVHPRCRHFRYEMARYAKDEETQRPIKAYDHGPDGARYGTWVLRPLA